MELLAIFGGQDAANYTLYPHLTLGIDMRRVNAMVTIPNAINNRAKRALRSLGEEGFRSILAQILKNMGSSGNRVGKSNGECGLKADRD